jgi:hypothetical protein
MGAERHGIALKSAEGKLGGRSKGRKLRACGPFMLRGPLREHVNMTEPG